MKPLHWWLAAALVAAVLASAVGVVHTKYRSRALFVQLNRLDRQLDRLDIEWNALLLEKGAWGAPQRIEREARRMHMRLPRADEIVVIRE